ncbi:TetR/AcrR family transcriptional regulator [Leptolyngbya cf. ectocarpi LEGE 11479]|uniref:TetR/AcrR family transcriptional regulator n=1 Tax=Leptolyngbya cf. ectocarpi LEGE 11479 TaxID=1828722 RepID=A0A929F9M5_LEPEC|nr:TetR/AcrR family transcriptional regulator [Leptolyngbya ectocarpi]MBE9067644.1 TetR/AcrR family transcriptional regulator [Leptolyngbya cf. ectocarpi LEGE 11479]
MPAPHPTSSSKPNQMRRQPQQARSQERVQQILDAAEQLFVETGYESTTTRAISARAGVSVGSLYQFFPDKEAILKALAIQYMQAQYQRFLDLHTSAAVKLPLRNYVDNMINVFDQFYTDYPGSQAIFEQLLNTITWSKIEKIDDFEYQVIDELARFFHARKPSLPMTKCEQMAMIITKTTTELLWLSLISDQALRQDLVAETKLLTWSYLHQYLD